MNRDFANKRRAVKRANRLLFDLSAVASDARSIAIIRRMPMSVGGTIPRLAAATVRALRALDLNSDARRIENAAKLLVRMLKQTEQYGEPVTPEIRLRDVAYALREIEDSANEIWRDDDGLGALTEWYVSDWNRTSETTSGVPRDSDAAAERRQMGIA